MFCFSRANHTSTNLKKAVEFKTRQVYFIYPFLPRLKLGKHLFAKQELITLARLRVQDLQVVRISLFITAITKSFAFISGKLFYKSNRKKFKNAREVGRILDSYANPRLCLAFENSLTLELTEPYPLCRSKISLRTVKLWNSLNPALMLKPNFNGLQELPEGKLIVDFFGDILRLSCFTQLSVYIVFTFCSYHVCM